MSSQLLALCRARLPTLYEAARAALDAHLVIEPLAGVLRVTGEGGGTLYLVADGPSLRVLDRAPAAPAPLCAVSLSAQAAQLVVARIEREDTGAPLLRPLARVLSALASSHARAMFAATAYAFDLQVRDLQVRDAPAADTLQVRVALGRADHPPVPEFSLVVPYEELKQARKAGIPPHQLFLSGKIKVEGDAAKAMMLAMTLAQLR